MTSFRKRPRNTRNTQKELIAREETYAIRGAAFEVYRELGCGFLESVYQECLAKEFKKRNIPFVSQPTLHVYYKGEAIEQYFKPDFICYDQIIIELKTVHKLQESHYAQLFNYVKASNLPLGLIMNFGHHPRMEIDRIAKTET